MATVSSSHQGHALSLEIELIPWDPESIEHVQRLYDQRIACGWNSNLVELWRTKQREGKKAIHVSRFSCSRERSTLIDPQCSARSQFGTVVSKQS